jgi:hypothetical protein
MKMIAKIDKNAPQMKFAIVDNQRAEATISGAKGVCLCGSELIAKCGEVRINHWAHKGNRLCDPWWEETEWHRAWKGLFPNDWQEVRQQANSGEWHIADVKTGQGWVNEFQHSHIHPDERRARNDFYQPKLVWIVDGTRRKRDQLKFFELLKNGKSVGERLRILPSFSEDECALVRDWGGSNAPVFFDFGPTELLWCIVPKGGNQNVYAAGFTRAEFIGFHLADATQMDFSKILGKINEWVSANVALRLVQAGNLQLVRQPPLNAFQTYTARRERFRRRF